MNAPRIPSKDGEGKALTGKTGYTELGVSLHKRLLTGEDRLVTAEISELFLPLLANALRRKFPALHDPHLVETAAIDTLMNYFSNPESYDPSKGSLIGYLYLDAYWDLMDALRASKKNVELQHPISEHGLEALIDTNNAEFDLTDRDSPFVEKVLAAVTDPVDRELVSLMMEGVRETSAFAAVLGIQHLPTAEQAATVKKHKDRLKKALRRRLDKQRGRAR